MTYIPGEEYKIIHEFSYNGARSYIAKVVEPGDFYGSFIFLNEFEDESPFFDTKDKAMLYAIKILFENQERYNTLLGELQDKITQEW